MATTTPVLISEAEYLRTVYRPDCDFIDGEVIERNMGEMPHGCLQTFFAYFFRSREEQWNVQAFTETRLQVKKERYRIPDVMLVPIPHENDRIVRTPPLLCVEILSSEDRMRKVQERVDDYAAMGVRASWVVDPWRGLAYAAGPDGKLHPAEDRLTVEDSPIAIAVSDIFAELDRLEQRAAARPAL